jgi:hypothetical protein
MRGKSNVIKRNVEKVWGACYLPKNTVTGSEAAVVAVRDLASKLTFHFFF